MAVKTVALARRPAGARAIVKADAPKLRQVLISVRNLLTQIQIEHKQHGFAVGGGRAYVRLQSFQLKRKGSKLAVKLVLRTTRIELDGAPSGYEERLFSDALLKMIGDSYFKQHPQAEVLTGSEGGRSDKIKFVSLDGIKVTLGWDSTFHGFFDFSHELGRTIAVFARSLTEKEDLALFGLTEGATREEISAAFEKLKALPNFPCREKELTGALERLLGRRTGGSSEDT